MTVRRSAQREAALRIEQNLYNTGFKLKANSTNFTIEIRRKSHVKGIQLIKSWKTWLRVRPSLRCLSFRMRGERRAMHSEQVLLVLL